jgi:glycosyltransferase involved in cell wall biosynthesis
VVSSSCVTASHLALLRVAATAQIPAIIIVNGYWDGYPNAYTRNIRERAVHAARRAHHLVFVSKDAQSRFLRDHGDELSAKSSVISNCCDASFFTQAPQDRATAKQRLGLDPHKKLLLLPARVEVPKGHALLMRALAAPHMTDVRERIQVSFLGGSYNAFQSMLERFVHQTGLQPIVRFEGHQADVRPFFAAADAVVLPSYGEGLPLVVCEAQACGIPVICSSVGDLPRFINDHNGCLLPSPRADESLFVRLLAQALQAFAQEPGYRENRANAARLNAIAHFHPSDNTAQYKQLIVDAMRHRPPARIEWAGMMEQLVPPIGKTIAWDDSRMQNVLSGAWGPLRANGMVMPSTGAGLDLSPFQKHLPQGVRLVMTIWRTGDGPVEVLRIRDPHGQPIAEAQLQAGANRVSVDIWAHPRLEFTHRAAGSGNDQTKFSLLLSHICLNPAVADVMTEHTVSGA